MCRAFSVCRYPFRSQPHHRYKLASVANLTQTAMFPVDCMCMFPSSRIPGTASTLSLFRSGFSTETNAKSTIPQPQAPFAALPLSFYGCVHAFKFGISILLSALFAFLSLPLSSHPCSTAVDVTRKMSKVKHKRFVTTFLPYPRV